MSKSQAARTFSVSLSSVKRYVNKAKGGASLAPKRNPGPAPKLDEKASKLLEDDLRERPFASLRNRYLLRKASARSKEALLEAIGVALSAVSAADARGFFEHAGYQPTGQQLP